MDVRFSQAETEMYVELYLRLHRKETRFIQADNEVDTRWCWSLYTL